MNKWELVRAGWFDTFRMKVPGGWIVKDQWVFTSSLCYVPDQNHKWKI